MYRYGAVWQLTTALSSSKSPSHWLTSLLQSVPDLTFVFIPVYAGCSRTTENSRHSTQKATTKNRSSSYLGMAPSRISCVCRPNSHHAGPSLHGRTIVLGALCRLHRDESIDCCRVDCFSALPRSSVFDWGVNLAGILVLNLWSQSSPSSFLDSPNPSTVPILSRCNCKHCLAT